MKKLILAILSVFIFCSSAYAAKVRVYKDYSPVRILKLVDSKADFDLEANKAGLKGSFKEIEESEIPTDKSERNFWKFDKGAIAVDKDLKKEKEDSRTKKENDKKSAIQKLKATGLTDDEIEALKIGA